MKTELHVNSVYPVISVQMMVNVNYVRKMKYHTRMVHALVPHVELVLNQTPIILNVINVLLVNSPLLMELVNFVPLERIQQPVVLIDAMNAVVEENHSLMQLAVNSVNLATFQP